jgi:SEC-C motif-containing protein
MSTSPKPSLSSSQPPSSFSGSSDSPFSIGGHKWLRLLLFATLIYIAIVPVWLYALDTISWVAANCANWIYHLFDSQVSINSDGKVVRVFVAAPAESVLAGKVDESALRMDAATYGLPMLAALIAVTRADSMLAKTRAMLVGLSAMTALTVPIVLLWAKLAALNMANDLSEATYAHSGDRSSFFFYVFHGLAFSQPVVAVAFWMCLLMLGAFRDKPAPEQKVFTAARNALCPCGSGQKFKRCCGLAKNRSKSVSRKGENV